MREMFRRGTGRHFRAFLENLKLKLRSWVGDFSVAETRRVFADPDQWPRPFRLPAGDSWDSSRCWRRFTG